MSERERCSEFVTPPRYPCHVCAGTMLPGVTYTFPSHYDPNTPSSGKVMYNPTMAACAAGYDSTAQKIVDCRMCSGTGWVSERRKATARRLTPDRRCARSESAPTAIAYVPCKAHEGMSYTMTINSYATPVVAVCPICNPPEKATP